MRARYMFVHTKTKMFPQMKEVAATEGDVLLSTPSTETSQC